MRLTIHFTLLVSAALAFVLVTTCSAQTSPVGIEVPRAASGQLAHALLISAGDLLDVQVFDSPELSVKARVDPSGSVTLPIGGTVSVHGLTAERAAVAVEDALRKRDIVKEPHVTVLVLEYATQGVTVTGEVKNPGIYPLLGSHGILDMIAAAGGGTQFAGKAVTVIHKADPTHPEVLQLEAKPGLPAANGDVQPGDTIVVSRGGVVYVVGDVGKPGGFLIENNDRLSVLQAIALAQGANRTAALNDCKLIRKSISGRQELPVPLKRILKNASSDMPVEDGDILFVPSSGKKNLAYRGIEAAVQVTTGVIVYRR